MSAPVLDRPTTRARTIRHNPFLTEFVPAPGTMFDTDGSEIVAVFSVDS
ncbi:MULTISPECIES: hypothetical protein [Nocardiaceae]|nr:hypothetical protein [Rhodococcus fascians]